MVVTRGSTAEAASLMQVVQDSGSVTAVFEYLELEELGRFSQCSRAIYELCEMIPRIQFVKKFLKTYSKSWFVEQGAKRVRFADDIRQFRIMREGLENDFARLYAPTEMKMLQNIASWYGGWASFLQTRIEGAPRPGPNCERVGSRFETPCKPMVIFDIYRDNDWQWSGLHPLSDSDLDGDGDAYDMFPHSAKCPGDPIKSDTMFNSDREFNPAGYLLSTDADDTRTYKITVSMVSPNFAETLLGSAEFVPQEVCTCESIEWYNWTRGWKKRNLRYLHSFHHYFEEEEIGYYRNEDGTEEGGAPSLQLSYYRDLFKKKPHRFHVILDFTCYDFQDLLVHPSPPKPDHNCSPHSKKRRL